MPKTAVIENICTLGLMVALILGLALMGFGGWSLWGLLLLFNINSPAKREK